uniref:hypothetical protein n=1 Tax=Ningiella ruwaisensis TaxID=2364274 RepID=UPI00109F04D6|nr:hypothetical protein [Ningiella ruwaisensis]
MYFDFAVIGVLILMNAILMATLSYKSAKNKTERQTSVVLQSFILSVLFFPAGWIHCWYWGRRLPDKGYIKLD